MAKRIQGIEQAMKDPAVQEKMQQTMAIMQSEEVGHLWVHKLANSGWSSVLRKHGHML